MDSFFFLAIQAFELFEKNDSPGKGKKEDFRERFLFKRVIKEKVEPREQGITTPDRARVQVEMTPIPQ